MQFSHGNKIWLSGAQAAETGHPADANPYGDDQMPLAMLWLLGWNSFYQALDEEDGAGASAVSLSAQFDESKVIRDEEGKFAEKPGKKVVKDKASKSDGGFKLTAAESKRIAAIKRIKGAGSKSMNQAIRFIEEGRPIFAKRALTRSVNEGGNKTHAKFLRNIAERIPRRKLKSPKSKKAFKNNAPGSKWIKSAFGSIERGKPAAAQRAINLARKMGATDGDLKNVLEAFEKMVGRVKPERKKKTKAAPKSKRAKKVGGSPKKVGKGKRQLVAKVRSAESVDEIVNVLKESKNLKNTRFNLTDIEGQQISMNLAVTIGEAMIDIFENLPEYDKLSSVSMAKLSSGNIAEVATFDDGTKQLRFNSKFFTEKRSRFLATTLRRCETDGWLAVGTVKATVYHELGHILHPTDARFGRPGFNAPGALSDADDVGRYIAQTRFSPRDLSRYAKSNRREAFAEAFSVVMTAPKARWSNWVKGFARALKSSMKKSGHKIPRQLASIPA